MKTKLEKLVLEIISEQLGISLEDLAESEEVGMDTVPEWDSLRHTDIILAIERRFEKEMNTSQAGQATDVAKLVEMLSS